MAAAAVIVVLVLTRHKNAVRGHRTGSNNSGLEVYLSKKMSYIIPVHKKLKQVVHI